jgi:hypothetical protein
MIKNLTVIFLILVSVLVFLKSDLFAADEESSFSGVLLIQLNSPNTGSYSDSEIESSLNTNNPHAFWNKVEQNKRIVPTGSYYYRLRTKESTDTRKMVLMR